MSDNKDKYTQFHRTDIVRLDTSAIERVPVHLQKYLIAREDVKIKDMYAGDLVTFCGEIYEGSYKFLFPLGLSKEKELSEEEKKDEIAKCVMMLREKFPRLGKKEVAYAIQNGLEGSYKEKPDEIIVVSRASFIKWINKYLERERHDSLKAYQKELEKGAPKIIPTPEELQKIRKGNAIRVWLSFLNGEFWYDYGGVVYAWLEKEGFITITNARKNEIYAQAKIAEAEHARISRDREAMEDARNDNQTFQRLVKIRAKNIALKEYFEFCKETELDLKTEIENGRGN